MRYHNRHIRTPTPNRDSTSWRPECREIGSHRHCWWEGKVDSGILADGLVVPYKLRMQLPHDQAAVLLGFMSEKWKLTFTKKKKNLSTNVHNSFVVAPNWKQPRCPSLNDGSTNSSRECYPAIKMNGLLTYTTIWMNLQEIMLSEKASSRRSPTVCVVPLM